MIFPVENTSLAQAAVVGLGRRSSPTCGAELATALAQLQTLRTGDGAFLCRGIRVQLRPVAEPHAADHAHHEHEILLGQNLQQRHDAYLEHEHHHQHARDSPHEEELGAQEKPEEVVVQVVDENRRDHEDDDRAEEGLGGDHRQDRHHQQRQHRVHGDLLGARAPAAWVAQPLPDGHASSSAARKRLLLLTLAYARGVDATALLRLGSRTVNVSPSGRRGDGGDGGGSRYDRAGSAR